MACMCGDSECPSCGEAQGTLTTMIYRVQFKHPHFGWLTSEYEFKTRQGAQDYINGSGSTYKHRIVETVPELSDR